MTSPVFVTTIVKVAFAPDAITCVFGLFEIAIAGLLGAVGGRVGVVVTGGGGVVVVGGDQLWSSGSWWS